MPQSRSISGTLVFLALLAFSIVMLLRLNVDSVAVRVVNSALQQWTQGTGYTARVRNAVYLDGRGFNLQGLELFDNRNGRRPLLSIESMFVAIPTELTDVVALNCRPTSIEIRRAKLSISQADVQEPRLRQLIAAIEQKPDQAMIPIHIRESTFSFRPKQGFAATHLSNVDLDVIPDQRQAGLIKLAVSSQGQRVQRFDAQGLIDLQRRTWQLEFNRISATCDFDLINLLPLKFETQACNLSGATGRISVSGAMQGGFDFLAEPDFRLRCQLDNFSVHNDSLPVPFRNCHAVLNIDNDGFEVERAQGQAGSGTFDLSYRQDGLHQRRAWASSGSLSNMLFEHRLLSLFPYEFRNFCHDYSPAGIYDMQFEVDSSGHRNLTAQIKDMSFNFRRFPFQLDHCIGNVRWRGSQLDFKIQTLEQQQLLEFEGQVSNPGKSATYVFHFGTEGRLRINEKLLKSLREYPVMENAFRDFQPSGLISARGTIRKDRPDAEAVRKQIRIELHDCDVKHRSFEYPMQNVGGTILVNSDGFRFEQVTGFNNDSRTVCNGFWNPRDGLRLAFQCDAIRLDQQLRNALMPRLQEIWDGLRPDGELKSGSVWLNCPPGGRGVDIRIQARLGDPTVESHSRAASIFPTWFPYRLEKMQGSIEIGSGQIAMTDIVGRHGKTWVTCDGSGHYSESDWSVTLHNLLAGSVVSDDDLLQAFPTQMGAALRSLQYQGQLNLSGKISFAGRSSNLRFATDRKTRSAVQPVVYESPAGTSSNVKWDLRLDLDQSSLTVGVPLENTFGSLSLAGQSNGDITECRGEVAFDSVTVYGMQITDVSGPIWIDNQQTLTGKFVPAAAQQGESLVGNLYGGRVFLDGWVAHRDKYPFFLQTSVENSELEDLAAEIAPDMEELSGDAYAFFRLRGNAEETHSFTGNGNVHLRNAKIHQLPVILALLKILSVKEITRTAFDTSNVDFTVKGDQIRLSRIELIGDAISLIGSGYMELFRYADINFYTVVGRNRLYIPLLSELYQAGSRRIMWINVGGPMNHLQTTRRVLPGLNDSIRALFENSRVDGPDPVSSANRPRLGLESTSAPFESIRE